MKIGFPTIRLSLHPVEPGGRFDAESRARLFAWGHAAGFDGVELNENRFGMSSMSSAEVGELRRQLAEATLEPAAVKTGGDLHTPGIAEKNERAMIEGIRVATELGAKLVSIGLGTPASCLGVADYERLGGKFCFGGSALARGDAYTATAAALRRVARVAEDAGVALSLEIAPGSIADTGASALRILQMVGSAALGINPDLGNLVTAYMEPEEDWRECLYAVSAHINHLDVKNVYGLRIPELQRTIFKRGVLWDGVIDYRFVFAHLKQTAYEGYCIIESAGSGDMLFNFEQGLQYVRKLRAEI